MKIAVNQPNYIPWLGYFDLIDTVDKFIFLDDVEYSRNSVISRNKISDIDGKSRWLSLSLNKTFFHDLISQKSLKCSCLDSHLNIISDYYRKSPYYSEVSDFLYYNYTNKSSDSLSQFNADLIKNICKFIGINCEFFNSSNMNNCNGVKGTKKIFCLIDQFQYKNYYNFSKGIDIGLYNKKDFSEKEKLLFKQDYKHPTYRRDNFQPFLSIVDLLFYELPNALEIIRSGRNWLLINPEIL
tara:strand:- start:117 stop:836 length:720 start_codon:yes stop_codon:yes gene_type:complete